MQKLSSIELAVLNKREEEASRHSQDVMKTTIDSIQEENSQCHQQVEKIRAKVTKVKAKLATKDA